MSAAVLAQERWSISFHETMAAVLRASQAIKRKLGRLGVLQGLWSASRNLKALNLVFKQLSEVPDGILDDEFIRTHIFEIRKLTRQLETLIDQGKSAGLLNQTFTGSGFESLRRAGEYIADYLDAFQMSIDPEVLKAIEEGRGEIERGEFEIMESLF